MTIRLAAILSLLLVAASPSVAASGRFDYWVLALSWSPQYCDGRPDDAQCGKPHDFIVHGLWPQYERGFPEFCERRAAPVPESLVQRMLPLMPSESLIRHQWRKHGTCSGLPMKEYFAQTERARRAIVIPAAYRKASGYRQTTRAHIEREFIAVNAGLSPKTIAVQCSGRWLREVRICMDARLQPRQCGTDVDDRCGSTVVMRPAR